MTAEERLRYEELVKDNFPYEEDPEMRGEIVSLMAMAVEEIVGKKIIQIAEKAVEELENEYPYKKAGDRDSYSQYREGIDTGLDLMLQRIKTLTENEE